MFTLPQLHRLRQILSVFFEYGFDSFIRDIHLHRYIFFSQKLKAKIKKHEHPPAVRLRQAFEKLGPTFIKLAQALSLRPDLLPPNYIKEFEKMQDHVSPEHFSAIKKIIKTQLGQPINKLFRNFNPAPLASASLAQVHEATLKNGKKVAVKVQRPNTSQIKQDIEILLKLAHLLETHSQFFRQHRLLEIIQEFKRWTYRELNFRYEAMNAKIFRQNFQGNKDILIPQIYDTHTTEKILTLQFLDAIPLHNTKEITKRKNLRPLMKLLYSTLLTMLFEHGFFHADPHPGNILVMKKGHRLAFVDFGIVGKFSPKLRKQTSQLMENLLQNNLEGIVNTLTEMELTKDRINKEKLKQDLLPVLEPLQYTTLKELKISSILEKLLATISQHKIKIPLDFVLFAKTVITLEGLALSYNPQFKFVKQTQPLLKKLTKKESLRQLTQSLKERLLAYDRLFKELPPYTLQTLKKLSTGRIDLKIEETEISQLRTELERTSGNLSLGIIIAALVVGSSLIAQVPLKPLILGYPLVSLFGFTLSTFLCLWLIKRTIFYKPKK